MSRRARIQTNMAGISSDVIPHDWRLVQIYLRTNKENVCNNIPIFVVCVLLAVNGYVVPLSFSMVLVMLLCLLVKSLRNYATSIVTTIWLLKPDGTLFIDFD